MKSAEDSEPPGRIEDIETRWSRIEGDPAAALEYVWRVYSPAIGAFVTGCLRDGRFGPLSPADADEILGGLWLRLRNGRWTMKANRSRGRFRDFLRSTVTLFLREQRSAALRRRRPQGLGFSAVEEPAVPDPLLARLEEDWHAAAVDACLRVAAKRNPRWKAVLLADLHRGDATDADVAARLGLSVVTFRRDRRQARDWLARRIEWDEHLVSRLGPADSAD